MGSHKETFSGGFSWNESFLRCIGDHSPEIKYGSNRSHLQDSYDCPFVRVNPVRNSSVVLNPAGIIPKSNPTAGSGHLNEMLKRVQHDRKKCVIPNLFRNLDFGNDNKIIAFVSGSRAPLEERFT